MSAKKIVFIHLFNNYSGSPKVLMQVIEMVKLHGYEVDLITNKSKGFLSDILGINYRYISYKWNDNKLFTLASFLAAQIQLFIIIIRNYRNKGSILYINTITPLGAAIAGKICNKKIIYHVHEKYIKSNFLNKACQFVYKHNSCYSIFVSKYLQDSYPQKIEKSYVIYNTLEKEEQNVAKRYLEQRTVKPYTILMVCSLRAFKGVYEFIELSTLLPNYKFELVVSASRNEVELFKQNNSLANNISVYESQKNLHPFYQRAKLLLNLSNPNQWVETFGLTILEAMQYGIPAIVPNVGGPVELIENGINGYLINPTDIFQIKEYIEVLMTDTELYDKFSKNAILKSKEFDANKMSNEINKLLASLL